MKEEVDTMHKVVQMVLSIFKFFQSNDKNDRIHAMENRIHSLENSITIHQWMIWLLCAGAVVLISYTLLRRSDLGEDELCWS